MSTSISALPIVRISTGVEIDEDFALSIAFTLADGVTPINLTGIVFAGEIDGPLTFSLGDGIVSGADDNVLTFAVPAAAKADWPAGAYDLTILATDSTVSPEISRDLLGFSTLTVGAPQVSVISVLKQAASGPPAAVSWVPANLAALVVALLEDSDLSLNVSVTNPAVVYARNVALTGSPEALPALTLSNGVSCESRSTNTGTVYLGGADMAYSGGEVTNGVPLNPGESKPFGTTQLSAIYAMSTNAGDILDVWGN